MKIILTANFAVHSFLFTEGNSLRDAMIQWKNDENLNVNSSADILDVLSGTGFNEETLKNIGFPSREVLPLDIEYIYKIANAGYDSLVMNKDWKLDYNTATSFKFCPFCYSFKSGGRRFYVLNVAGKNLILSNYNKNWTVVPLKHQVDRVSNYVPVNKE